MTETKIILEESWKLLINKYTSGELIFRNEKDMEKALLDICQKFISEQSTSVLVESQKTYRGKIVDLILEGTDSPILVQLKFYRDKADWKESPSMTNTVESDLKFTKGQNDTYVGIIDTIPSTPRAELPYTMDWKTVEIDKKIFEEIYSNINPRTSPPRERKQNVLLSKGTEI